MLLESAVASLTTPLSVRQEIEIPDGNEAAIDLRQSLPPHVPQTTSIDFRPQRPQSGYNEDQALGRGKRFYEKLGIVYEEKHGEDWSVLVQPLTIISLNKRKYFAGRDFLIDMSASRAEPPLLKLRRI